MWKCKWFKCGSPTYTGFCLSVVYGASEILFRPDNQISKLFNVGQWGTTSCAVEELSDIAQSYELRVVAPTVRKIVWWVIEISNKRSYRSGISADRFVFVSLMVMLIFKTDLLISWRGDWYLNVPCSKALSCLWNQVWNSKISDLKVRTAEIRRQSIL